MRHALKAPQHTVDWKALGKWEEMQLASHLTQEHTHTQASQTHTHTHTHTVIASYSLKHIENTGYILKL